MLFHLEDESVELTAAPLRITKQLINPRFVQQQRFGRQARMQCRVEGAS